MDDWLDRILALVAAGLAAMGAFVDAATAAIDRPAEVATPAERGDAFQATEPPLPTSTPYRLPVADTARAAWHPTHASYPATDVFVGCGATIVSPVHGTLLEVRRVDAWDPAVDDPATRGGRSIAIRGFDGVRYYLAHFDTIAPGLRTGDRVELDQELGTMGDTGRSSACHLHLGFSPPCAEPEWRVRRGVVWPFPYLDAWRAGEQRSPAPEVAAWSAANPTACETAAGGAGVP